MITIEARDRLCDRLLKLAEGDDRVVAGALVGSLAVGEGDRFSDLDLTFGILDDAEVATVLADWTRELVGGMSAVGWPTSSGGRRSIECSCCRTPCNSTCR